VGLRHAVKIGRTELPYEERTLVGRRATSLAVMLAVVSLHLLRLDDGTAQIAALSGQAGPLEARLLVMPTANLP
jgi:hypothetical protein